MTQLALLLALGLLGLALSFVLGRLEVKRGPVSPTLKRLEGALERASLTVLRLGALRGLVLLAVPALGLAGFALHAGSPGPVTPLGSAVFCAFALLGGAGTALLQARFTLGLGARAVSSAAAAAARGSTRAVRPLLRAAAAAAIFSECLGLLGVAAAFACLYSVLGGFATPGGNPELVHAVVKLLPAFALGAAIAALALAREGSVAASAARIGGAQASNQEAAIDAGDPRDPALLAELVGHQVGELLPRAMTTYVCGVCATVSSALLGFAGGATGPSALSCLTLVLVVRAFGAVGAVCGVLAARATDEEAPTHALFRAQVCALLVALFGLGSALFWLERPHFAELFAVGALGLLASSVVAQLAWLPLRRTASTSRELFDARSSGDAAAIVRAAGSGLSQLWPALVLPALALAVSERYLATTAPVSLLRVTFAAGAIALAPFALAVAGFGSLVDHTRGVAALARLDSEPRARSSRLDDVSALGRAVGGAQSSLVLAASLLLGLLALLGAAPLELSGSLGLAVLGIVGGVSLVLLFAARSTGSALRGARLVQGEVERQLRELPRQAGIAVVPTDFTPSYRACVDAAATAARGASVPEAAVLLLTPFLLGVLLKLGADTAITGPLVGFALAAVLSGVVYVLAARSTRALLAELRRRSRSGDHVGASSGSLAFSTYGELVGVTAAASVEALISALALSVLCLASLLS